METKHEQQRKTKKEKQIPGRQNRPNPITVIRASFSFQPSSCLARPPPPPPFLRFPFRFSSWWRATIFVYPPSLHCSTTNLNGNVRGKWVERGHTWAPSVKVWHMCLCDVWTQKRAPFFCRRHIYFIKHNTCLTFIVSLMKATWHFFLAHFQQIHLPHTLLHFILRPDQAEYATIFFDNLAFTVGTAINHS